MSAFEWFEQLRAEGERIARIRRDIDYLDSRIAPRAAGFEAVSRGAGNPDAMVRLATISAKISELEKELTKLERAHTAKVAHAKSVLYGRSGRGGLARTQKRRGTTYRDDADILCLHFINGEGWTRIARRFEPETSNLAMWCKCRAQGACKQIDRIGMDSLADS